MSIKKKEKLYLDEVSSMHEIGLDSVKYFFVYKSRHIYCIDENEKYLKIMFKGRDKYIQLWNQWSEESKQKSVPKVFEYPTQLLFKETREFVNLDVFIKIGFLVVLFLLSFSPVSLSPLRMFFLFLFLSGPLLLDAFTMRVSKRFFKIIILGDSILNVCFTNGRTREFSISEIEKCFFKPTAKNAYVIFSDGTRLVHLERISYWPILREYLLSKLEPSAKNKTQEN